MKKTIITFYFSILVLKMFGQDYFPNQVGSLHVYNILENSVIAGTDSTSCIQSKIKGQTTYYTLKVNRKYFDNRSISINSEIRNDSLIPNDIYLSDNANNWGKIAQHNYTGSEVWFNNDTLKVKFVGNVTVPAGTFSNCYSILNMSGFGIVVAPGVGMIKHKIDNIEELELKSYNLPLGEILKTNTSKFQIELYPNPCNNTVFISCLKKGDIINIRDISGKTLFNQQVNETNIMNLDLELWDSGMYILTLLSEKGNYYTSKLIKN